MSIDSINWQKYKQNIHGESQVTFGDNHVGGCNIYGDPATEHPKMWKYLADTLEIKSVIDVGCGFGFHLKYFKEILGLDVLGIEGSSKVVDICFCQMILYLMIILTARIFPRKSMICVGA